MLQGMTVPAGAVRQADHFSLQHTCFISVFFP